MVYCVNCGVKLAETEKKCPLCETVVCYREPQQSSHPALYPSNKMPKSSSGSKALNGAVIILFFVPLIVCFFCDLQRNRTLDWFGYVAGALVVSYVALALPMWFRKPNPVIFAPCSFAAVALYLLYINLATNGGWYFRFALPIVGVLCLLTCAVVTLVRYIKRGRLYIFGGASILFGGFMLLIEYLLKVTFGEVFIGWSFYPMIVLVLLGGLLIYLAINRAAREMLERKLFF